MEAKAEKRMDRSFSFQPRARAKLQESKKRSQLIERRRPRHENRCVTRARPPTSTMKRHRVARCALRCYPGMRYALCGYALCLQLQLMLIMRYALCCAALHFHFHALTLTLTTTRERVTSTFETRGSTVQVQYCTVRVLYLYLYYVRTVPVAAWRCFLFVIRHFWFWLLG